MKHGRWIGWALALAILVGLWGGNAAAGENSPILARIVESGEFKVGTSGTQPPFSVKSKDGKLIGYEIDLARLLAAAMGVELRIVQKPFGQLLAALEQGEVDAVMSAMTMTPERNLKAAFVGPYYLSGKSILTKSATLAAISATEEIDDEKISLVALENSTSERFVRGLIPKAKLTTVESYDQGVQMVLDDKVGAMVADYEICVLSVLRYPEQDLATLTVPLTLEPIGIALPPGDSLLLNLVENYLTALELAGLLEGLEQKWFEDGAWLLQLP
jgi:polar amino acid transport system substrate-binding protein